MSLVRFTDGKKKRWAVRCDASNKLYREYLDFNTVLVRGWEQGPPVLYRWRLSAMLVDRRRRGQNRENNRKWVEVK